MLMCVFIPSSFLFSSFAQNYEWLLCMHDASAFRVLLEMQQRQWLSHTQKERKSKRKMKEKRAPKCNQCFDSSTLHRIYTSFPHAYVRALHLHTHRVPQSLLLFDLNCFICTLVLLCCALLLFFFFHFICLLVYACVCLTAALATTAAATATAEKAAVFAWILS